MHRVGKQPSRGKMFKVCKYRPHMIPISNNVAENVKKKVTESRMFVPEMMKSMAQVMVASGDFQGKVALWREPGNLISITWALAGGKVLNEC